MLRILLLVTVAILTQQAQEVRFTYEGKAYDIIHSILGKSGYEVPDCGHHVEHITTLHDSELGKNVFGYDLHVNQDDDRCIKQDRQRSEMAVDAGSPAWMHGSDGKTYSFSWKFKLDAGFKESGQFCDLHQIKLDGANVGVSNMSIKARNTLNLEFFDNTVAVSSPLSNFKGYWVTVRETVTYGPAGCVDLTITRIKDGAQLIRFNKCGMPLGAKDHMIRPKWGFYRGLGKKELLRDERVLQTDHCLGEGKDTCKVGLFG